MNILLFAEDFMLNGVTRHMIDVANGLVQQGHTVVVASTPSGEELRLDKRVNFLPLSLCQPLSDKKKYGALLPSIAILRRAIHTYQIQILHTHKRYADAIGRIVSRMTGTIHVSTCHNEFDTYTCCSFFGDRTIAPCETIAKMLIEQFHRSPETVEIIPYGIQELNRSSSAVLEEIKNRYGISSDERIILSVGHLSRQKDRPTLLEAIRILKDSGEQKNVVFLIVGEGHDEPHVRSLIQQYHLEHMVKLLPARSNISALNSLAEFCVLSSIHETWTYVLLEAACLGKPFIATRVGCIPSFMAENTAGVCVSSQDPVQLEQAIENFLKYPEDVRRKGEVARKRFEQYHTFDSFIAHMSDYYQRTISERNHARRLL
jgi:glycosyltransferase involved in cell wall biosynthesis